MRGCGVTGWSFRMLLAAAVVVSMPIEGAVQASRGEGGDRLRVFFVDVEGGQSTLFVTPKGQSLLIDTGWPDHEGRDADRIVAAARSAGLTKIDYVLLTHYHDDHVGGVPQLVARMPVGTFVDHGPNREMDRGVTEHGYAEYQKTLATSGAKRLLAHPGDVLPIAGMTVRVISADGALIASALPGSGQTNEFCKSSEVRPADMTENGRSLGVEITFGKLTMLDLGDLTWDKEMQLMCPTNKLGKVEVYIVSHHGWLQSSSPALVRAIRPRIAIMNNGETKGGSTPTLDTLAKSPGSGMVWQLHASKEGENKNTAEQRIANLLGTDAGYGLELTAEENGRFDVRNARTGRTVEYPASEGQVDQVRSH